MDTLHSIQAARTYLEKEASTRWLSAMGLPTVRKGVVMARRRGRQAFRVNLEGPKMTQEQADKIRRTVDADESATPFLRIQRD